MHYVNWRSIPQPGKKDRKIPWDAVANDAVDHLNPANWLDEQTARSRMGGDIHLAVVLPRLTGGEQYAVFLMDLDDAVGPDGQPLPWAADLLARFPGAYVETSHSGTGYHVMGHIRPDVIGTNRKHKFSHMDSGPNKVEYYHDGRFTALGQGAVGDLMIDWTHTIDALVPVKPTVAMPLPGESTEGPAPGYSGPSDDDALLELMRTERLRAGGDLAPGLFATDFYGDHETMRTRVHSVFGQDTNNAPPWDFDGSSVDMALANHLAYYTGGDVLRMERLFARSVMGQRDKAQQRPQYVRDTVTRCASEARAAGRFLNRPTLESLTDRLRDNPHDVDAIAGAAARLSAADRTALTEAAKAFGVKTALAAAIKAAHAVEHAKRGADIMQTNRTGPFAQYFVVENEKGAPVVIDSRGGMDPQSRAAFRDAKAHVPPVPIMDGKGNAIYRAAADVWFEDPETPRYHATGYDPNRGPDFMDDYGRPIRNIYTPHHNTTAMPGDITPFLHIIASNFPDPGDQHTLMIALASMAQRPGKLLRWAPVLQGSHGCGKGSIVEAVAYCHGPRNTAHPTPELIGTDFNGYMYRKTLVIVNEIGKHTKRELSELAETMKPWITDDTINYHTKGKDGFDGPNYCNWLFTTNYINAMLATPGERRYAHFISRLRTEDHVTSAFPEGWWNGAAGDWFTHYDAWKQSGGSEAIRAHLMSIDVSAVPVRAPKTTSTRQAITAGEIDAVTLIREAIEDGAPGFRNGWISANAVRAMLTAENVRVPGPQAFNELMQAIGLTQVHRVNTSPAEAMRFPIAGGKTRLYSTTVGDLQSSVASARYDQAQQADDPPRSNIIPL